MGKEDSTFLEVGCADYFKLTFRASESGSQGTNGQLGAEQISLYSMTIIFPVRQHVGHLYQCRKILVEGLGPQLQLRKC
jgi:hypothetical protein